MNIERNQHGYWTGWCPICDMSIEDVTRPDVRDAIEEHIDTKHAGNKLEQ